MLGGGSSRLDYVTDLFSEMFRNDIIVREDVETIVSLSAAITALQGVLAYPPIRLKEKYDDIFSKTLCISVSLQMGIRTIRNQHNGLTIEYN